MKKNLSIFILIFMIILSSSYGCCVGQTLNKESEPSDYVQYLEHIDQNDQTLLNQDTLEELLNSLTIQDVTTLLQNYVNENTLDHDCISTQLSSSVTQGIQDLTQYGITQTMSFRDIKNRLGNARFTSKNVQYHSFLISILPVQTTIRTVLPRHQSNLTHIPTALGNITIKIEIFTKVLPFLDRVVVRQGGYLRPRLTESSILWPTLGGRITAAGFTVAIVAFGPRIKWTQG